ncbi:alpha/beta fold hydrolase [Micromonospora endolithica]|uniref:Alpha/beta fold hydrolase n=1 Tax=Micromonospora endolithica TaxID=230091 RepID=A0A3A9YST3_9ACTN|nr:alpha/beta hydrolase [Micromonospora endolithica]RKN39112.1 alpha/beta fold hydrolase [Micromonospora endolithica]TWJ25614.1 pimeloyl-ACP methyl ester carboxylesterase [Micromonospora endolithica]
MAKIEVNGATLAYDEAGTGSPVVLLHAGIADRRMWRGQLPALADRHRVIVPDLRGYGDSELPPTPFAHHDDVVGLLDALGIERAALVGCSFGGAVAIDTALAHPDRITALALLGAAVSGNAWSDEANDLWDEVIGEIDPEDLDANAAAEVRFWVVGPRRDPKEVDPNLTAFAFAMDLRALAAERALSAVEVAELDPPAIDRLAELRIPVLATAGAADLPDVSRLADRIAAEAPEAVRLPDVPDAAHLLPLERPAPVNNALLTFLP